MKWASSDADYAECQKIMAHPEIWPHHTPVPAPVISVKDEECAFVADACMFLFRPIHGTEYWECHTSVLPEKRSLSKWYATQVRKMFFDKHPKVDQLWTLVPEYNKPAARLARSVGFADVSTQLGIWKDQTVTYMVLTRSRHEELEKQGCPQQSH